MGNQCSLFDAKKENSTHTGSYQWIDHTALCSRDAGLFGQAAAAFKTVLHLHGEAHMWVINSKKHTYMYLEAVMSLFLKRLCCPNVKVQYTAKNMIIKAWQLMHLHYFNSK